MKPRIEVRLNGRSARFVELLQELGYFDTDGVNRLLLGTTEVLARTGGDVDLQTLRRVAAMLLMSQDRTPEEQARLERDWDLLFS